MCRPHQSGPPFPEGSIRGQHDRSGFITGGNHLEQQIGPTLVDGRIAQLIEKEKTGTKITLERCFSSAQSRRERNGRQVVYLLLGNKTKN